MESEWSLFSPLASCHFEHRVLRGPEVPLDEQAYHWM